jgi:hypothetical protein
MRLITTFPTRPFNRHVLPHARNCVPTTPRSIVRIHPVVACGVGRDRAAHHCHCAIRDDATRFGARAASRPAELSLRRIFQAIGCLLADFLKVCPTKSVLLRILYDVVEQYSLRCHNITKTNAIFLAKNDVNKEALTNFLTYILTDLALNFMYTSYILIFYSGGLQTIDQP